MVIQMTPPAEHTKKNFKIPTNPNHRTTLPNIAKRKKTAKQYLFSARKEQKWTNGELNPGPLPSLLHWSEDAKGKSYH